MRQYKHATQVMDSTWFNNFVFFTIFTKLCDNKNRHS